MKSLYVSIAELRQEGLSLLEMNDDRAFVLIDRMSKKIDLFTQQFFSPREKIVKVNGKGISYTSYHNEIPIIKINSLKLIPDHTHVKRWNCVFPRQMIGTEPLSVTDYTIDSSRRRIELIDYSYNVYHHSDSFYSVGERFMKVFPEGSSNVEIDGVFGNIENQKEFETTVTSPVLTIETLIHVDDASGFEQYDHLIIDITPGIERRITDVDYDNNTISIDQPMRNIPTGTILKTYGAVPGQIAECVMRLINRYRSGLLDPENEDNLNGAIFKEKTDMYSWEAESKFINGLWNMDNTNWASTGDLIVDRILQEYVSPIYVGIV